MEFGYLPKSNIETGNLRTEAQLKDAIKDLQVSKILSLYKSGAHCFPFFMISTHVYLFCCWRICLLQPPTYLPLSSFFIFIYYLFTVVFFPLIWNSESLL